ncbi:Flavoprotein-like domain [Phytophthora cactorum]|nr:Flavoprotein-like domain [Phytophthora cactorum]
MAKIAIVYYSTYNHVSTMAETIKKGIESVDGPDPRRPQEGLPYRHPGHPEGGGRHPVRLPTRFGSLPSQMKAFFDSCGGLWAAGALVGKPAGIFFSTGTQGGGQETTAFTALTFLAHQGLTYVPLGYRAPELANMEESTAARPGPSKLELTVATTQGKSFAEIAKKLAA